MYYASGSSAVTAKAVRWFLTLSLALPLSVAPVAFAQTEAANLISNGDFEKDTDGDGNPDSWGAAKGGISYTVENGNRFMRIASLEPDKMVLNYRQVKVPEGTKALELTWKERVTNLKKGKQSWFDARIMLQFKNAAGDKMTGGPSAPNAGKDTAGWVEKSKKFLVPDGAVLLEMMPCLFQVTSGEYDLDDFALRPTDPVPLADEAKARETAAADKLAKTTEQRQQKAAAAAGPDGELLPNGDFQLGEESPDKWGKVKEPMSWQKEGDNRFLRIQSVEPGKMVLYYRAVDLPKDTKALELKWKERLANFKRGKENYYDARIMIQFQDAAGKKIKDGPAPAARKDTAGWEDKSKSFLVPEGAVTFVMMPCLFQVESGTFDLDNFSLKPTDPAPLLAVASAKAAEEKAAHVDPEKPNPAKFPAELRVAGTKIVDKAGREILLQGVNVDSLEWSVRGEQVLKSTLVAVDDWKSNCIRLPVVDKFWFGQDSTQKDGGQAYRELVDNVISLAANRGAYVMLDLHRFRAPKKVHVDFWKDAATRYKNHPAVIFELFNEPHGVSWEVWRNGGFVADKDTPADEDAFLTPEEKALNTKGFHSVGVQALVNAVRETGAKNIVLAGGLDWAYDLSGIAKGFALEEKGGNGLVYTTHIYAGKRDWTGKVLVVADKYPLMVSECGANDKKFAFIPAEAQEDAVTWVPRLLGFIQKHKFNWTAFSLHPKSAPVLITGWDYTPTPEWGALAKRALAGEKFPAPDKLR